MTLLSVYEFCSQSLRPITITPKKLAIAKSMEMSFFVLCPWPRPGLQGFNITLKMPYSLRTRNVILNVASPDPVPVSGRGGQALKQGPVLGPDNRDVLQRDNISIIYGYQIPIIRATPVHL